MIVGIIIELIFFLVSDVTNPPVREIIVEAGKNVTLDCPGVTEQSLISTLEWRANSVLIVEYSSSSTTVSNHRDRVSFFPKNFSLLFHPVESTDSGDYQCVVNNRKTPETILRIIVQGRNSLFTFYYLPLFIFITIIVIIYIKYKNNKRR